MIDVLLNEASELVVAFNGFLDGGNLLTGNVARDVFAISAGLMVVVRPVGTFADDGKAATFQTRNLRSLLEEGLRGWFFVHWEKYIHKNILFNKERQKLKGK